MPRTLLTEISLRALKSNGTQVDYWDTKMPGFGVRVGAHAKTFVVKHANRRHTIGRYPDLPLGKARELAKKALSKPPTNAASVTFKEGLELFLQTHCARTKPRTKADYDRVLSKHFAPILAKRPLEEIETHQVASIVDRLLKTPAEATHAFATIRTFFRWAVKRRYISRSPIEGMGLPAKLTPRDHVLSDPDLLSVWTAADRAGYSFGTIVRLCILTGQRRSEVAALRWEDIDADGRTIKLPQTKNNRSHKFPYGQMVADILSTIPTSSGLLFPARGKDTPFNGWSKAKVKIDNDCPISPWTLHDLRRTFATNLAALRVPPHITERLLNHVSGTISGVAAIYNRHAYMDEMRDAVSKWENYLTSLLKS
jgi:integrase